VISKSFDIIFRPENQEPVKTIKKHCLGAKNDIFLKNIFKKGCVFPGGIPEGIPCLISCEKCRSTNFVNEFHQITEFT